VRAKQSSTETSALRWTGRGFLCRVDSKTGKTEQAVSFWRDYALVGTSLPRDGGFKGARARGQC
jgi:hypothetical protein